MNGSNSPSHTHIESSTFSRFKVYIEDDFDGDKRLQAMGFVGEHSEREWLYKLQRHLDQGEPTPFGESTDRLISSVNYFQDESAIALLEGVDLTARPPPQQIADQLVDDYFQTVHPVFPVIDKPSFLRQYRSFYSSLNMRFERRWLAILNLIIAISVRHSLLVDNRPLGMHDEHNVYFSRSWFLNRSSDALLASPNLHQVQVEALTAFYLLSVGQVNR
ncbi:C6 transcription factor [Penicillium citrinum]|uniref:C6 transcription factor n=1 Tax=Penicillium citrinum TaxID=5077 RepID=A0A9W9NJ21_PENCI|nr:C6 transcription factor [Penicillium citrinum]KAJ5220867.1 C6 transcription factor [Penicillium citrinum]